MNFYSFSLFVVLCFGPWATAGEAYFRLRETSAGATSETKRKSNGESNASVINGLIQAASQARTWTQYLRRFLKALRKWCNAHPPEVKLGKCLAGYFDFKIPGLKKNTEKIARFNENSTDANEPKLRRKSQSQRKTFSSLAWDFLKQIQDRLKEYTHVMFKNELVVCMWDYLWKKFWIWVDSAPDSRGQV